MLGCSSSGFAAGGRRLASAEAGLRLREAAAGFCSGKASLVVSLVAEP